MLDDLIEWTQSNPEAAIVGAAVVVILAVLAWGRIGRRGGIPLRARVDGLKKQLIRARYDKHVQQGGAVHDLLNGPLQHWPDSPLAFYIANLAAVEALEESTVPPTEWPEAATDKIAQDLAHQFMLLSRAIANHPKPGRFVPRAQVKQALQARAEHRARMGA